MIVYTDESGWIKSVNMTTDPTLIEVEILDDDENPFIGKSNAFICCYRIAVSEGHIVMMTPAVDTRLIPFIDKYGEKIDKNTDDIENNNVAIAENSDAIIEVSESADTRIVELEDAIIEIVNLISGE